MTVVMGYILFFILFICYLLFQLIDCVSQVCGSCLEQTTWLRRNFAVREQEEDSISEASLSSGAPTDIVYNSSYSVQAQLVLTNRFFHYFRINKIV